MSRIEAAKDRSQAGGLKDTDILATALNVTTDDFLKNNRSVTVAARIGLILRISYVELITIAVKQALVGFTSERRWLRHVNFRMVDVFPALAGQPGYNKRLRKLAGTMQAVLAHPERGTGLWSEEVWVADSTPVERGRSRETTKRSDLARYTWYGYRASHCRNFRGFR